MVLMGILNISLSVPRLLEMPRTQGLHDHWCAYHSTSRTTHTLMWHTSSGDKHVIHSAKATFFFFRFPFVYQFGSMHLSADNDNPKSSTLRSRLRSGANLSFSLLDCCGNYGAFTMQQEAIQKFVFSKQYIFASCVSTEGIRTAKAFNLRFLYETVHASRLAGTRVFFWGGKGGRQVC